MTPLLKKLAQADEYNDVPLSDLDEPLTNLIVRKKNLKSKPPLIFIFEHNGTITADVGIEWLNQNLNEEEFAEYAAMKLKGHVT